MKKLLFTFAALLAMLFAFSSCDALLDIIGNQENQTEKKKEDDDKPEPETKVPATLADFAGEAFVCYENPETGYGTFAYVKDAKTISFLRMDDEYEYFEDSEIDESGIFWNEVFGRAHAMKIVDGRFFIYISSSNYEIETYNKDLHACEKMDDSAGLIGTWRYCDTSDHPRPCDYEITTNTITKYVLDDSDYDTRTQEWSKTYTEKNGLLLDSDNDILAYYDGESLHTEGINELIKITDAAKAKKIKKAAGIKDEDEKDPESAAIKIDDVVGNVYFLQQRPDSQINDIQVNLYYIDDSTTITQFYQNSSYYDNDLPMKNMINAIKDDVIDISHSYYNGDMNRNETETKTLSYAVYDNSIIAYDTGESFPLTKTSGGDGLYGTWEVTFEYYQWGEYHTKTVKLEIDETTANSEKYTNENGYIIIKHGEGWDASYESFYYDGKTVYREPYKLAKVTDVRKIRAIKSELGVLEKDPVPQNVNDLIGKYYFFQVNPRYTHDNHSRNAAFYMHVNSDLSVDFYQIREGWDFRASWEGTFNLEGDTIPTTCFYSPLKIRFTSNNVFCCKENSDREPEVYEKVDGKEGLIGEWKYWNYSMVIEEENGVLFFKDRWNTYEITNDDGFLTVRNKEDGDGSFWYYDGKKIYTEREYCMNLLQVFDKETIDLLYNTDEQVILFN